MAKSAKHEYDYFCPSPRKGKFADANRAFTDLSPIPFVFSPFSCAGRCIPMVMRLFVVFGGLPPNP